jgi:hypothetical protein
VIEIDAWPRYVERALALTPAAMQIGANVWRHSWSTFFSRHARAFAALSPGGRHDSQ